MGGNDLAMQSKHADAYQRQGGLSSLQVERIS
jgi:hypothetical protein